MSDQINNTNQPGGSSSLLVIGFGLLLRGVHFLEDDGIVNFLTSAALILGMVKAGIEIFKMKKPKQK